MNNRIWALVLAVAFAITDSRNAVRLKKPAGIWSVDAILWLAVKFNFFLNGVNPTITDGTTTTPTKEQLT